MSKIARTIAVVALAAACGGCWAGVYESPAAEYLHRSDTITLSAGNAKDVNAAIRTIDPWPRQVRNRRIPGNGERMVGAMQRYQGKQTGRGQAPVGATGGPTDLSTPASVPPAGVATPTLR